MKVLVCDDETTRYAEVVERLNQCGMKDMEVVPLIGGALTAELEKLFERVESCLKAPASYRAAPDLAFDNVDLAIFDNNLAHLDIRGARLTGESVVGYVRCFSAVPFVVSLNKNPDVDFDLRYLVGDYETRADLALNTEHLANRGLWSGSSAVSRDQFRPWYWPVLSSAPARRRAQIRFVRDRLDVPVLEVLGFPIDDESLGFLSLHAKGALFPDAAIDGHDTEAKSLAEITFRDVFSAASRSLPAREERVALAAGSKADNADVDELLARVVAADVDRWFRRDVLGPQEMLVDVPHLLARMPFLLGQRAQKIDEWNKALDALDPPFGMEQELFDQRIAPAMFAHDMWVPSAAFWWPRLKRDDQLGELFFASTQAEWPDAVFCEDLSGFTLRAADGDADGPIEFSAEFEGSWGRRHVAKLEGIRYAPRSRFAV